MIYRTENIRRVIILDKEFPQIVTLCGSTKFKKEFLDMHEIFENRGYIVLTMCSFHHKDKWKKLDQYLKDIIDDL